MNTAQMRKRTRLFVQLPAYSGTIVLWAGELATIPSGWVVCDGTNDTPDLRGKFVYGWGAENVGTTGGSADFEHSHLDLSDENKTDQNHLHTHTVPNGSFTHTAETIITYTPSGGATYYKDAVLGSGSACTVYDDAGPHTHTHAMSSVAHVHTIADADAEEPAYVKLFFIMKT